MAKASSCQRLSIKKYPNRRFYDSTRSCHVTLDQIHQLIRTGHDVQITDSKTGQDITVAVLSQILLELDSFKLSWFPNSLLHHVIRNDEPMVREFMDVYFNQAFEWFLQSRQSMEQQMRQMMGLGATMAQPPGEPAVAPGPDADGLGDLNQRLADLAENMQHMQERLTTPRPSA